MPRAGILAGRANTLSRLAAGSLVTREHELVDPARCRIWAGHNRDYANLDEDGCADLLQSLKAQGRQEVPAIVRRLSGDPAHDYEVICGARRHWSISWLRAHNYPEFRFLVEARELTDEEAFRLADLENRHRKDLSDFERATDYARAIERYYGGSQKRMVERLEISASWLSRYLELARLPGDVVQAFGSPHVIAIKHAAILAPLLRAPLTRERVLGAARAIAVERTSHPVVATASEVVRRLAAAADLHARGKRPAPMISVRGPDGTTVTEGRRGRAGAFEIVIHPAAVENRGALLGAIDQLLAKLEEAGASRSVRRRPGREIRTIPLTDDLGTEQAVPPTSSPDDG